MNERENELRGLFHTYNKYIDNFFTEHKKEERSKRMVNLNDQISNELDLMLEYSRLDHSIKNNNLLSGYKTLSSLSRSDVINLALADFVFRFYEENDVKIYDYYRKYDRLEGECDEVTK